MHQPGKILVAEWQGAYVIKLVGDVRLTFCTALDEYIEHMLDENGFTSVLIDLRKAQNIDSTTLGQLAKLAIAVRDRFRFTPVLVSNNPDINRIIDSMAFDRLFDIRAQLPRDEGELEAMVEQLPAMAGSESAVRDKVLEAHRVLMGISEENRAQFSELVTALEGGRC